MGTGKGPYKSRRVRDHFETIERKKDYVPVKMGAIMTTHVGFLAGGFPATRERTRPSCLTIKNNEQSVNNGLR